MLTKGHHLPHVTLVGILDADQGLFGADFRAGERMGQLIVQVAGRAGRADKPGEVLIQTHHPDHPQLIALLQHDYRGFAHGLLDERRQAGFPYGCLALLRAESVHPRAAVDFLAALRTELVESAPRRGGNPRPGAAADGTARRPPPRPTALQLRTPRAAAPHAGCGGAAVAEAAANRQGALVAGRRSDRRSFDNMQELPHGMTDAAAPPPAPIPQ